MAYNFTAEWVKGTKNGAPDALSRNPVTDPSLEDTLAKLDILSQPDLTIMEIRILTSTEPLPHRLDDLRQHAQEDTSINNSNNLFYMDFHSIVINYQMLADGIGTLSTV